MRTRALIVVSAPPARSLETLARAGVAEVEQVEGDLPGALRQIAAALRAGDRLLVVDAQSVLPTAAVARLADDPSVRTGVLVSPQLMDDWPVRVEHGHVVSAPSGRHTVTGAQTGSLGAFAVQPADTSAAAAAVEEMAACAEQQGWSGDVVDLAVVALVRREVAVLAVTSPGPTTRSSDPDVRAAVAADLDTGGDERALRESANRVDDGFYSTFVLRRLSKPLTEVALRLGLSPNQVSLASFAVGLVAAGLFAWGTTVATVTAALLFQVSLVIDCVDGEVARRTRKFSALGAWLDASTDRVKEYAVYAGLAVAAARDGDRLWLLAGVVLVLQTTRHMSDYDFARVQRIRETWVPPRALTEPGDGLVASRGSALDASRRASRRSWVRWAKKVIHLPIGERWLVISVLSVLGGPRVVLSALLGLGLLAAAYTTAGRLLRVRAWDHPESRSGRAVLVPQLDLGPVAGPLWRRRESSRPTLAGPLGWAVPALLRLAELGLVLGLTAAVVPRLLPWAYALVFVLAYHHYDTLYRALGGSEPPRWLVLGGLGLELRVLVLVVAAAVGEAALQAVLIGGACGLGGWFVVVASTQSVRSLRKGAA